MEGPIFIASLRLVVAFALKVIIVCLRQVVTFAPKVIIDCLRQVVAFAPKVMKCAAYGVAIMNVMSVRGECRFMKLMK